MSNARNVKARIEAEKQKYTVLKNALHYLHFLHFGARKVQIVQKVQSKKLLYDLSGEGVAVFAATDEELTISEDLAVRPLKSAGFIG